MWRLQYPTQKITKEVNGETKEVTVIGATELFHTHESAKTYAAQLLRYWPNLVYTIMPVTDSRAREVRSYRYVRE